jgi:iron complex transport system substrate-binding protein
MEEQHVRLRSTLAGAVAGLTLLVAACGDDDDTATTDPAATDAPATTTGPAGTTGSSAPAGDGPSRIVSLSPTHTEILFAIGAGDQVVAVDDQSNFPPEAEAVRTDLSGFEPNVEAIAGYEPDLVVTSGNDQLTSQLEELGITVWVGEAATTFDDTYAQIEQLGAITGHVGEAAELVAQMQTDIAAITESMPTSEAPLAVYHELDPSGFSANSSTFIGHVYSQLGLQNIADQAEGDTGYPQLNAETIIAANPDLIFLADPGESVETVSARDGWADVTAVTDGNVFVMNPDIASRWGPRVVEYMQQVADAVQQALVPAGG